MPRADDRTCREAADALRLPQGGATLPPHPHSLRGLRTGPHAQAQATEQNRAEAARFRACVLARNRHADRGMNTAGTHLHARHRHLLKGASTLPGTETLLIVEDEATIRELLGSVLQREGYRVLKARHGLEALEMFNESVDLLLTDMRMPHLSGEELIERLRMQRAALKVLSISGYQLNAPIQPDIAFLAKPFSGLDLLSAVRSVLDGAAAGRMPPTRAEITEAAELQPRDLAPALAGAGEAADSASRSGATCIIHWEMFGFGSTIEFRALRDADGFVVHVTRDKETLVFAEATGVDSLLRQSSQLREHLRRLGYEVRPLASRASQLPGGLCWGPAAPLDPSLLQSVR